MSHISYRLLRQETSRPLILMGFYYMGIRPNLASLSNYCKIPILYARIMSSDYIGTLISIGNCRPLHLTWDPWQRATWFSNIGMAIKRLHLWNSTSVYRTQRLLWQFCFTSIDCASLLHFIYCSPFLLFIYTSKSIVTELKKFISIMICNFLKQ